MHTPESIENCSLEMFMQLLTSRIKELDRRAFIFSSQFAMDVDMDEVTPLTYGPVSFLPKNNAYVFDIAYISSSLTALNPVPNYWKSINDDIEIMAVAALRLKAYVAIPGRHIQLRILHESLKDTETPDEIKRTLRSDSKLVEAYLRIEQVCVNKGEVELKALVVIDVSIVQHYAFHIRSKRLGDDALIALICT